MKILKTFVDFVNEADAATALKVIGDKEQQKQDINQDRETSTNDKKFQDKTKQQAQLRADELDKAAKDIGNRQQTANNRMEDIKLKQDLLPDDPNARKQFLADTDTDLKDVKGELDNAQQQRNSLQKQKDRIKNNFLRK
jgi:chromosome segregation ATPase